MYLEFLWDGSKYIWLDKYTWWQKGLIVFVEIKDELIVPVTI